MLQGRWDWVHAPRRHRAVSVLVEDLKGIEALALEVLPCHLARHDLPRLNNAFEIHLPSLLDLRRNLIYLLIGWVRSDTAQDGAQLL